MSEGPVVSIIICTRNRADSLRSTLEALAHLQVPADMPAELLVVDNNSSDKTAEVVKSSSLPQMTVRYLFEGQSGLSRARNAGMAASQGHIILFTDDDVRPSTNWIEGMCRPILSGKSDAVAGGVLIPQHLKRNWTGLLLRGWFATTEGDTNEIAQMLLGLNMAFSRRVLEDVPAFDPEIGSGALGFSEDSLFSFQLIEAGYKVITAFDASVEHHFDASRLQRKSLLQRAVNEGCSTAYMWHHWLHVEVSHPHLRAFARSLELRVMRFLRRRQCAVFEGSPEWELELLRKVHCYKHFAIEAKRPRNYHKRGLVKLHGVRP